MTAVRMIFVQLMNENSGIKSSRLSFLSNDAYVKLCPIMKAVL